MATVQAQQSDGSVAVGHLIISFEDALIRRCPVLAIHVDPQCTLRMLPHLGGWQLHWESSAQGQGPRVLHLLIIEGMSVVVLIFRVLASCTSMMMILSPVPAVYKIYKTHSVGYTSIISLVSVLANCHVWTLHGYLNHNIFPVFATFGTGEIISIVYIIIYYRWTTERAYVTKVIVFVLSAMGLLTLYASFGSRLGQEHDDVTDIVGYCAISVTLILYASPFERVCQVFRHRSAVFIPIHMVIAGVTNNAMWVTYTTLDRYWFMFFPNLVSLILGSVQVVLYLVFNPKTHPHSDNTGKSGPVDTEDVSVHSIISDANSPTSSSDSGDGLSTFRSLTSPERALALPH